MASISKKVSERLSKETRKFQKILRGAKDRDINESDTVLIITDMLARVFGFDKFLEVTSEYKVKGTFCDLAVIIDENVKYLIEVKAIGLDLKETHLRQAVSYGAHQGIQWVVLTNGIDWEIYRITFGPPLGHDLLCAFNFLDLNTRKKDDQEILYLLCKEGLSKDVIEKYRVHLMSVNKFRISAILQSDTGLNMLRRELKRVSPGTKVETDEISDILTTDVLKRDVVEGDSIKEAHTRVKKASARKLKVKSKPPKASPSP